jgi:D-alanyl-D-alanine carboxypeptidase
MWVGPVRASPATDAVVARQAKQVLDEHTTTAGPGVAALIARGDKLLFRSARGLANLELGVQLAPDQVFHVASITKMFTAAFVLKLAESSKISLDDQLSVYLPDVPYARRVTLRRLLDHTAGVSDRGVVNPQPGFRRRDVDIATLVGEIGARPLDFEPGTQQAYSNAGYILLGAVIEKVTGKPWHLALQERLLQPLGLSRTQYGAASVVIPGRVAGYTSGDGGAVVSNSDFVSMSVPASAGALVSTLDDLRLWMRALTSGRVISAASFAQMTTPAELVGASPANPYGFGVYIWRVRGETMIGHTGQIDGFASVVGYIPSRDTTVVALANDDSFDARTFGRRLAAVALERPYPTVAARPISAADMQALAGTYQDGAVIRTFSVRGGKLYSQRGSGNTIPLQMAANGQLHFRPDELSYFALVRDSTGSIVGLDYFQNGEGPSRALPRIPTPHK